MKRKPWTDKEVRILVEMWPDYMAPEVSEKINRPINSIYNKVYQLGLKSSPEKLIRIGKMGSCHPKSKESRFKKGHVSHNKGKKMSPALYEKLKHTMFQKGRPSLNQRPVGSERVNVYGYVEVKVAEPRTWKLKHRVVWEEANGKIPPGHNVQFRNGDKQDIRLENLYLISHADQMAKENSMHARYPEELKAVIRLKGSIKRQITEYNKKNSKNGKESKPRSSQGTSV